MERLGLGELWAWTSVGILHADDGLMYSENSLCMNVKWRLELHDTLAAAVGACVSIQ